MDDPARRTDGLPSPQVGPRATTPFGSAAVFFSTTPPACVADELGTTVATTGCSGRLASLTPAFFRASAILGFVAARYSRAAWFWPSEPSVRAFMRSWH